VDLSECGAGHIIISFGLVRATIWSYTISISDTRGFGFKIIAFAIVRSKGIFFISLLTGTDQ